MPEEIETSTLETGLLLQLAAIEVSDAQIGTPEFNVQRYSIKMPDNGLLKFLVDVHSSVTDNPDWTQGRIGQSLGVHQSTVSRLMLKYPMYFDSNGKGFITRPLPVEWIDEYNRTHNANEIQYDQRLQLSNYDRKQLAKILSNTELLLNKPEVQTIPLNRKNRVGRAFLNDALIDELATTLTDKTQQLVDAWTFDSQVILMIALIHELEQHEHEALESAAKRIAKYRAKSSNKAK